MSEEIMKNENISEEKESIVKDELPAIADDRIIQIAEEAEKRIEAIKKIKVTALRVTNEKDWVDENGKPYLQASGCEKIARIFGISWNTPDDPEYEELEGGHYMYTYRGTFSLGGASIEAIGTRSSKDTFFTTRYEYQNGKKNKIILPATEVDKGTVKKAAFSNLLANGITRLLGIRNLTYEDLEQVGIKKEKITGIHYRKDEEKAQLQMPPQKIKQASPPTPKPESKPDKAATTKQIWKEFKRVGLGNAIDAKKFLEGIQVPVSSTDWDQEDTEKILTKLSSIEDNFYTVILGEFDRIGLSEWSERKQFCEYYKVACNIANWKNSDIAILLQATKDLADGYYTDIDLEEDLEEESEYAEAEERE